MNKNKLNKNRKAFTLIELLVVIAIVGILSGLVIVQMNGAINVANDAKRKSNLDTIRKALVIYGTLNGGTYPIQSTLCNIGQDCANVASALSESLPTLPVDPVSGYYTYISDTIGSRFTISAPLSSGSISYSSQGGYVNGAVDVDGNSYGAVVIGTQTWLTSNLMTTRYRDGTAITRGPSTATWDGADHGYYAYPQRIDGTQNEETLANIQSNKLGFVYQQSTTTNSHGLCPSGWHVPTDAEFKTLVEYLGTTACEGAGYDWYCSPAGASLKEAGTAHWSTGNTGTNTSGFSAVGVGYRGTDGSFYGRSVYTYLWSSSSTLSRDLRSTESRVYRSTSSAAYGFSVRCLKD